LVTRINADNDLVKDAHATAPTVAGAEIKSGLEKLQYCDPLAAIKTLVDGEPDDARAAEAVADILFADPLGVMFGIMDAELGEDAENAEDAAGVDTAAGEGSLSAGAADGKVAGEAPTKQGTALDRERARVQREWRERDEERQHRAAIRLRSLAKEAARFAQDLTEPRSYRRTIRLSVLTYNRKFPPSDISWNRQVKNRFYRVFAKTDRLAAIKWATDALLKGWTVSIGSGGYNLWGHVDAPQPPTPPASGASAAQLALPAA
jgi:hypothetical protein